MYKLCTSCFSFQHVGTYGPGYQQLDAAAHRPSPAATLGLPRGLRSVPRVGHAASMRLAEHEREGHDEGLIERRHVRSNETSASEGFSKSSNYASRAFAGNSPAIATRHAGGNRAVRLPAHFRTHASGQIRSEGTASSPLRAANRITPRLFA
jgi:hypothetical protein